MPEEYHTVRDPPLRPSSPSQAADSDTTCILVESSSYDVEDEDDDLDAQIDEMWLQLQGKMVTVTPQPPEQARHYEEKVCTSHDLMSVHLLGRAAQSAHTFSKSDTDTAAAAKLGAKTLSWLRCIELTLFGSVIANCCITHKVHMEQAWCMVWSGRKARPHQGNA